MVNYYKIKIGDIVDCNDRLYEVTYKSPEGERWVIRGRPLLIESRADWVEWTLPKEGIEAIIGQTSEDFKKYLLVVYDKGYKNSGENFEDVIERFATDDFYKAHEIAKRYLKVKNRKGDIDEKNL